MSAMVPPSETAVPALRLSGTSVVYPGGVIAVDALDLTVAPGEFCVILGPSGSGKSTLLRVISGLVKATAGSVALNGTELTGKTRRDLRRRLGMVHQDHGLVDRLSVLDNVMAGRAGDLPFWRLILRLFPRDVAVAACRLLAEVGLTEKEANRRARELSGGQRQRVGIARALMADPRLILADEPVASLDPQISREILSLLRRAARDRGAAVVCSLHQMDLAREFADRIIVMRSGCVIYDGSPTDFTGFPERSHRPSERSGAA